MNHLQIIIENQKEIIATQKNTIHQLQLTNIRNEIAEVNRATERSLEYLKSLQ